ncbi:MAG: hypothetical protein PF487_07050 [Bacteroidales bacterium]|nr:hypothetical protein [Bacteroidales bacterium]
MNKFKFLIRVTLLFTIVLTSCEKEDFNLDDTESQESFIESSEGIIVLGKQLEDPYAIKNMKQAYSNLKSVSSKTPDVDIQPTHTYMRFLPNSEEEWGMLKSDTTLVLYDFPLDYEIKILGTYYHDPSLPETAITWQYCVVPIGYNIPNIQHELLYEVYIPDDTNLKSSPVMSQFLIDLEYESVKLTGNLPGNETGLKNTKGKWTPKGTIKVWDNLIGSTTTSRRIFDHWEYYDCGGDDEYPMEQKIIAPIEQCKRAVYRYEYTTTQGSYIPLIQASVHARWFTHIERDLTDANGYFQTSQFRYKVNYAIKWERGRYDIRNGMIWQAWYNGPKKKGDWNLKINGGKSIMYATMHRAAYKQFYGDNLGIRRPYTDGKAKLCYIDEKGTGIFWGDWIYLSILPDIKVWGKDPTTGSYKPTNEIFGTTTHELGHLSHWWYVGVIDYAQTSETIYESWATAVEWALTNHEYHTKGEIYGGTAAIEYYHEDFYQRWTGGGVYTPIFIDLMDDFNQRNGGLINGVLRGGSSTFSNDLISGYTLAYIQNNILNDAYGLSSLRDAIKDNKISGVTDADVDQLFALYW